MSVSETFLGHILVVDDREDIRDPLVDYLTSHGFSAEGASSVNQARYKMKRREPDLLVIDVMMPGEDGLSFCRAIRSDSQIPIILLSAMAEELDRVIGLEMGADDYVTKPFSPRELVARIKTVLRRVQVQIKESIHSEALGNWRFADWQLDGYRRVLVDNDEVITPLSTGEYRMLLAFVSRPNTVLSRDQLLEFCQGREAGAFDRAVDNQISRLRKKIEVDPKNPKFIQTVWGGGYKFVATITEM